VSSGRPTEVRAGKIRSKAEVTNSSCLPAAVLRALLLGMELLDRMCLCRGVCRCSRGTVDERLAELEAGAWQVAGVCAVLVGEGAAVAASVSREHCWP
jgi:hypothetical protein